MKTTVEIPDPLFRQAKSRAAERGQTLKEFFEEALRDKLRKRKAAGSSEPAWMSGFGKLRRLHRETARVQKLIDQIFDTIEPEDRM